MSSSFYYSRNAALLQDKRFPGNSSRFVLPGLRQTSEFADMQASMSRRLTCSATAGRRRSPSGTYFPTRRGERHHRGRSASRWRRTKSTRGSQELSAQSPRCFCASAGNRAGCAFADVFARMQKASLASLSMPTILNRSSAAGTASDGERITPRNRLPAQLVQKRFHTVERAHRLIAA